MNLLKLATLPSLIALCLAIASCQILPGERKIRAAHRLIKDGYIIHPRHKPISCEDAQAEEFIALHYLDLERYIELTEDKQ